jgi:hypothetical protein
LKAVYMSTDEVSERAKSFRVFAPPFARSVSALHNSFLQFVDLAGGDALNYLR